MALPVAIRQILSDMHDEASLTPGETVSRDVTLGSAVFRLKMVVYGDGNIVLRTRRVG
jgi:hypothetical protein